MQTPPPSPIQPTNPMTSSASSAVLIERRGPVGLITLNKPSRLNAWDQAMRDQIVAALRDYDRDAAIGAVVMTGAGERAFSAGQDFAEAHDFDADRAQSWIREWETFYGTLRRLTKLEGVKP